VKETNEKKEK